MQQTQSPDLPFSSSAVADAVVSITRRHTGRGPTEARAVVGRDVVMVLLHDVLSAAETALAEFDVASRDQVLGLRRTYQAAMRADLVEAVERLTGRTVVAFLSANHTDPDYAAEIFVLGDPAAAPA